MILAVAARGVPPDDPRRKRHERQAKRAIASGTVVIILASVFVT
jgi:hypothetical protein